jgi:hypothetical protein
MNTMSSASAEVVDARRDEDDTGEYLTALEGRHRHCVPAPRRNRIHPTFTAAC